MHPGFDLDRVVTVGLDTRSAQLTDAQVDQWQRTALTRIRGLAQVAAVSGAEIIPLSMDSIVTSLEVDAGSGEPLRAKVNNNSILPEYFRVMGIARLAGRDFVEKDRQIRSGGCHRKRNICAAAIPGWRSAGQASATSTAARTSLRNHGQRLLV